MRLLVLNVFVLGLILSGPTSSQGDGGARGAGGNERKLLIAGGENAPTGRFSYMCSLRYQGSHEHFCGATMILPNWILTAAHCIDIGEDNAPLRPIVYCGIDRLDQNDTDLIFDVRLSHLHPRWSGNELNGYDIALLKLDRNASLALELLPELESGYTRFEPGEPLTTLGWGRTLTSENSNELRMAREMEFVPSGTCNEEWWEGIIKEDRMICAGLRRTNICPGDSASPLIRVDAPRGNLDYGHPSRDLIVGIASFNHKSARCGGRGRPVVFTKIAFFVDWISEKVGEDVTKGRGSVSSEGPPPPEAAARPLSDLLPYELAAEMKEALKRDDDARARDILEYLHVNATLEGTIPGAGPSNLSLLHGAAMFDAPKCAQMMIDTWADVETQMEGYYKMVPLHICGIFGALKVAKVLLSSKNGAAVDTRDSVGDTAMHKAAAHGHVKLLEFLIKKTAKKDLFPINHAEASPFHEAARAGQVDVVTLLLERGADINDQNGDNWTALHQASFNNHTAIVKVLLDNGAKVDAEDTIGQTALHKACWNGNYDITHMLLQALADSHHRDRRGFTALQKAIWNGYIGPVNLLLRSGISPNDTYNEGHTALHLASAYGHTDIAKLLIEKGASVEAEDDDGDTPLSEAVENGHLKIVKLLVSKGSRMDTFRGYNDETLLHVASRNGDVEIVKTLLRGGADVHAAMTDGDTPLHEAAENGRYEVVKVLLDAGALKNVVDIDGNTPRDLACRAKKSCDAIKRDAFDFLLHT